ncbi:hypothetical protein E2320_006525 [Naja naja]|nr:hypothetical protein E2320_006525 [Naja naja]
MEKEKEEKEKMKEEETGGEEEVVSMVLMLAWRAQKDQTDDFDINYAFQLYTTVVSALQDPQEGSVIEDGRVKEWHLLHESS